jgi:hypothetical protein
VFRFTPLRKRRALARHIIARSCRAGQAPATNVALRLVKNHFAGPANQCYKAIIEELDVRPPGMAAAGFCLGTDDVISKMTELKLIARTHTRTAVAVLIGIARSNAAPFMARIAAANSLLDRGWGRPAQMLANEDGNALGLRITEIVNTIVDPQVNDGAPMLIGQAQAVTQSTKPEATSDPAAPTSDESCDPE